MRSKMLFPIVAISLMLIFTDRLTKAEENKIHYKISSALDNKPSTIADSIVNYARTLQGVPYLWAGKSPQGFDCSGLVYHVFNKFGVNVPAGSSNLFTLGRPVSKNKLNKGDLVFFTGTNKDDTKVGHVGIVISETGEKVQFIHSSSGGGGRGVTINDLEHPQYAARYLGAKRILFK